MDKKFPLTGWGSVAVHAGHEQDPLYAHLVPIFASSTFVYDEAEQGMRRIYMGSYISEVGLLDK
jgi:methionine-gamma-lyase